MSYVSHKIAYLLAKEVCKDLHPNEVYELAEDALTETFMNKFNLDTLKEEYEERYDYVFECDG